MNPRIRRTFNSAIVTLFLAACSSKPPQVERFSTAADPTTEIERTAEMLQDARERQVDVLSPSNYTDAEEALQKARSKQIAGKPSAEILEQVSYARGWLKEAQSTSEIVEATMKNITDARAGSLRAGANRLYEKDWKKTNKDLADITTEVERGNLKPAEKNGDKVTARFRELEVMSVTKSNLGVAIDNLASAKKQGADKSAPKTYNLANMKKENAERIIKEDPRNYVAIQRASADANRESMRLLEIAARVNAGNTEDLVLTAERQQRTISNLRTEQSYTERELATSKKELTTAEKEHQELLRKQAELAKSQELLRKAATLRNQFKPNEAEVFAENGKLKVRLKALNFPSGQAELGPKNQALLKKVESAIATLEPAKITIEGHTDATGGSEINKSLSERRAQVVGDFLKAEGTIEQNKIMAVGKGAEEPIGDNNSPYGRAENRRIDMVIETE